MSAPDESAAPPGVSTTTVRRILTRTSGYLLGVCSHSLQPYAGCTFGRSLCGTGCYVQHNRWLTRGRRWGSFLEARVNAAPAYRAEWHAERRWGRAARGAFSIFMSSSTDPFLPHEQRFGITREVLAAMVTHPPDELVVQTHSHRVAEHVELLARLAGRCRLRVHVSIESDRDRLPGLPPPASTVAQRIDALAALRAAGLRTVATVSPLLPIADPRGFLERLERCADAVVVDHFIGGDGSADGTRTAATALPAAMAAVDPASVHLAYRDAIVAVARAVMPGRVGVGRDGFAGRLLP